MLESRPISVWVDEVEMRPPLQAIWRQAAMISLTFALVDGFGAYTQLFALTPMKYVGLQVVMLITTLVLSPPGKLSNVFLPIFSTFLVAWWVLGYLWASNRAGWISVTMRDLTVVISIVLLAQILGRDDFIRCLWRSGYIAIGLIFVALVVQPGLAYQAGGIAPGLKGGFNHKNTMAPVLLLTVAVVICMHPNRLFRRWFVVFVAALLFLGQTTTGLATLVALVLINSVLSSYKRLVQRLGRSAGVMVLSATMVAILVSATTFSSVVQLSGKDLTFSSRTTIWEGVNAAISHRFWEGYGYGVWENIWIEPVRSINAHNTFLVAHAHSAPLDLMLRLGAVGLILYLLLLLSTVRVGWRALLRDDATGRLVLLYCTMLVLVGFAESLAAFGVWLALLIAFAAVTRESRSDAVGVEL